MMYREGISREGDLLDLASEQGLVHKSGAWYSYQDNRIGQGRENAKKYLKEHPELELLLRRELGLNRIGTQAQPADPDPNNGWWDTEADDE
jgi:recombination protein RecA